MNPHSYRANRVSRQESPLRCPDKGIRFRMLGRNSNQDVDPWWYNVMRSSYLMYEIHEDLMDLIPHVWTVYVDLIQSRWGPRAPRNCFLPPSYHSRTVWRGWVCRPVGKDSISSLRMNVKQPCWPCLLRVRVYQDTCFMPEKCVLPEECV